MARVELLIGEMRKGEFTSFLASFAGEKLGSHEEEEGLIHSLYSCEGYDFEAYRVYTEDERDISSPKYTLKPRRESGNFARPSSYQEAYAASEILREWPIFAKYLKSGLRVRNLDG